VMQITMSLANKCPNLSAPNGKIVLSNKRKEVYK
jgi:hypothetical protein